MNYRILLPAACSVLLFHASASADVVVNKTFRPMPGLYKLELRDASDRVYSKLVTAEVYERYDLGSDFSDRLSLSGVQIARATRAVPPSGRANVLIADKTRRPVRVARALVANRRKRKHHVAGAANVQFAQMELKKTAIETAAGAKPRSALAQMVHISPVQDLQAETEGF